MDETIQKEADELLREALNGSLEELEEKLLKKKQQQQRPAQKRHGLSDRVRTCKLGNYRTGS